jgi:hypothetical protein
LAAPARRRAVGLTAASPAPTGRGPAAFFAELRETWDRAAGRVGHVSSRSYDVGGLPLRVNGAGPALLGRLTRALAHLPEADGDGLDVYVWDDETTRLTTPFAPWGSAGGEVTVVRDHSGDVVFWVGEGRLDAVDLAAGEALVWRSSPETLPLYEEAAPLRAIVLRWVDGRGLRILHAGAVGRKDGCVLIVGQSGAGKSTTSLACLGSELSFISDDFCLVRGDDPTAFSIYSSAKLSHATLTLLPHLASVAGPPEPPADKSVAFLHEHVPETLLTQAPVRAVVLPRVSDRRVSTLRPAGRGEALFAMTPSSIDDDPTLRHDAFRLFAALASSVPCHVLELGRDVDALPALLAGLLDG